MDGADVSSVNAVSEGTANEELWSLKVVLAKTGLSRSTLYSHITVGSFPRQRSLDRRRVGWFASQVRIWIASRPAGGTELPIEHGVADARRPDAFLGLDYWAPIGS
jgi:prophage regulatory protein